MKNETAYRELANEFPNVVIRASAGTGKTFALSNRYLRLLASGCECHTILASTFTKKGAGEILDRIVGRLADAALDPAQANLLAGHLQWNLSQTRAGEILHQLLRNLHRLEIGTLDSFFSRIAKVFSLELGLPPNWDIVEEQQMRRLYDVAISQVLQSDNTMELLSLMGKGEVARRIATVLHETVDNIYKVYLNSGNAPWNQIARTQGFLSDGELERILLEMEAIQLTGKQLPNHWAIVIEKVQQQDWNAVIHLKVFQNFLDNNLKYGQTKLPPEVVDCLKRIYPQCKAYLEDRVIHQNLATQQLLEQFDGHLQLAQSQTGKLRFDDVTNRLQSFVQHWDTERCSFRLDQQIQHVLLDEFQDTSLAQWRILRPFAVTVTSPKDQLRSFFCVGDMKQAIYGWRGGIAEIFDLVVEDLKNLKTDTFTLSYRSAVPVIDFVNQVFLNTSSYHCDDPVIETAIERWTDWFEKHSTAKTELAGYVTIEKADHEVDSVGEESERDRRANRRIDRKTMERVQELVNTLPRDRSIGVIVRTNAQVSRLIAELQAIGIHASEEGGVSITDSAAIDLILAAMTLADHPGESLARFHLSNSPLAAELDLQPETTANQAENARRAIQSAARLRSRLIGEGYGPVVEDLARQLVPHCTVRELARLQQLVQVAYTHANQPDLWELRPKRFADFVRDEVRVADPSGSQVRVMTIHKAKGLEFDAVVYPIPQQSSSWSGMTPSVVVGRESPTAPINFASRYLGKEIRKLLSPEIQQIFEADLQREIREAMCVLYVALTRAAQATHIIVTSDAKPDHKSAAGLLLATACRDSEPEGGLLYQSGDPQWYRKHDDRSPAPDEGKGATCEAGPYYLPANAELKPGVLLRQIRSARGGLHESPSLLAGGDQVTIKALLATRPGESQEQRELLRACFLAIQWLDQQVPTRDQLERHLRELYPSSEPESAIQLFYAAIEKSEVRKLLSLKTYQSLHLAQFTPADSLGLEPNRLEVNNGRRFSFVTEQGTLDGAIDRLLLIYEGDTLIGADVIDFKTESLQEDSLQATIEHYAPQLSAYRAAVSEFTNLPLEQVSSRVVFLNTGQVVNYSIVETAASEHVTQPRHAGKTSQVKPPGAAAVEPDTENSDSSPIPSHSPSQPPRPSDIPTPKSKGRRKESPKQQKFWDD